jgi:hypothetical protein
MMKKMAVISDLALFKLKTENQIITKKIIKL